MIRSQHFQRLVFDACDRFAGPFGTVLQKMQGQLENILAPLAQLGQRRLITFSR